MRTYCRVNIISAAPRRLKSLQAATVYCFRGGVINAVAGDKSADLGEIAHLQKVMLCFGIVVISAIAERIENAYAAFNIFPVTIHYRMVAPCIVLVFYHHIALWSRRKIRIAPS